MTFYIPPFWCGVIATIVVEFVSITVLAIVITLRDKEKEEKDVKEEVNGLVGTYDGSGKWNENAEELKR